MHYYKFKYNLEDYFQTAYPADKRQENRKIYSAANVKRPKGSNSSRKKSNKVFTRDPNKFISNIPTLLINPALANKKKKSNSLERILRPASCIQRIGCENPNSKHEKLANSVSNIETSKTLFRNSLFSPKNEQERIQLIAALPEREEEVAKANIMKTEPNVPNKGYLSSEPSEAKDFEKILHKNKDVFNQLKSMRVSSSKSYSRQALDAQKHPPRLQTFSSADDEPRMIENKEMAEKLTLENRTFSSHAAPFSKRAEVLNEENIQNLNEKLAILCNQAVTTAKQNKRLGSALKKQKRKIIKESCMLKKVITQTQPYTYWKDNGDFLEGKAKIEEEKKTSYADDNNNDIQKKQEREDIVYKIRKYRNHFLKRANSKENLKASTDPDKKLKKMELIEARYLFVYKSDLDARLKEGIYEEELQKKMQDLERKQTEVNDVSVVVDNKKQKAERQKEFERQQRKEDEDAKKFKVYKSIMKHAMKNSFLFSSADREKYFGTSKLYRGGAGSSETNPLEKMKGSWSKLIENSNKTFQNQQTKLDSIFKPKRIIIRAASQPGNE